MSHVETMQRLLHVPVPKPVEEPENLRTLKRRVSEAGETVLGVHLALTGAQIWRIDRAEARDQLEANGLVQTFTSETHVRSIWIYDATTVQACVEAQTLGRLNGEARTREKISPLDAALTNAIAEAILPAVDISSDPGFEPGARFGSAAEALLVIQGNEFHLFDMTLQFDHGTRIGRLQVLVAARDMPSNETAADETSFAHISQVIGAAPIRLEAELYRTRLSIAEVEALSPGSVLEIPEQAISEVRLRGASEAVVARGKLGQMNGFKAVRVQSSDAMSEKPATGDTELESLPATLAPPAIDKPLDMPSLPPAMPELPAMEPMLAAGTSTLDPAPAAMPELAPISNASPSVPPLGDAPAGLPPLGDAPAALPPLGDAPASLPPLGEAPTGLPPLGDAPAGLPPLGGAPAGLPPLGAPAPLGGLPPLGDAPSGLPPLGDPPNGLPPLGS